MFKFETIIIEDQKPMIKIIFNRTEKANAMNQKMNEELYEIFTFLQGNQDYRYVVITGSGNSFSSGADVKEIFDGYNSQKLGSEWIRKDQLMRQEFLKKIDSLDQITIASINGVMMGAGFALAMVCDFRIMANEAIASLPEVDRGLFFSGGGTPRLVNLVGAAKAKELIMLSEMITAPEAFRIGLVNWIVPKEDLTRKENEIISKLNSSPFKPIQITKKIANASIPSIDNLLLYELDLLEFVMLNGNVEMQLEKYFKNK